jgi:hypothetical protein
MYYYHFLPDDGCLRWGTKEKVKVKHTLILPPDVKIKLCEQGFHASKRAIDALQYAPGSLVCLVTLHGEIIHGQDKSVAQGRTVIAMADATNVLHEMACLCAEQALALIPNPDPRSMAAIKAKRAWLRGEITDLELAGAWDSAWAARAAAWDAARDAAWDAAWAAQNIMLEKMLHELLKF